MQTSAPTGGTPSCGAWPAISLGPVIGKGFYGAFESQKQKKKGPTNRAFFLMLAERTGLEPATPDVTGRYSNQLNYHSVLL
jgi:hypothetical protein